MELVALPSDRQVVRRYVETLWLPFHRELADIVADRRLATDQFADEAALVDAEVQYRCDWLDDEHHVWIAVETDAGDTERVSSGTERVSSDTERVPGDTVSGGRENTPGDDVVSDLDLTDEGVFAGFVTCEADPAPPVFDRPDRVRLTDLYLREPYRGSGLARRLVGRVAAHARETDCPEVALTVDEGNDRAQAFYRMLGFETHQRVLTASSGEL